MRLLLDTHILIWLVVDDRLLLAGERAALARAGTILVSAVSIWELRIKVRVEERRGRRPPPLLPRQALDFCEARSFTVVPLLAEDGTLVLHGDTAHADPFDELLLVQAQRLGARLLTRDAKLLEHPLAYQA